MSFVVTLNRKTSVFLLKIHYRVNWSQPTMSGIFLKMSQAFIPGSCQLEALLCHPSLTKSQPPIFPGSFLKILMNGWHANLFYNSILIYWFTSLSRKLAQLCQNDPYRTERRTGPSKHHRWKLLLKTCSIWE